MKPSLAPLLRSAVAGAALLAGLSVAHAETKPDVKYALVVGNSAYASDAMKLKNPAKDAADMAATLKAQGFEVDLQIDATEDKFRDAVGNLERKAFDADITLFYYAGHGMQFRRKNFLLPVDNVPHDIIDVKRHAITVDKIVEAAAPARKAKIIILDACRDGKNSEKRENTRSLGTIGDGDGLAAVDGAEGLIVFFSAQHGKVAYDGDKGDHSPFAESMLRNVAVPGRKITDVLEAVSRDVSRATQGVQEPEILTASLGGESEIYLNPRESSAAVWRRVKVAKDPKALKQFIADYPDSPEAETAQAILDRIDLETRERERAEESRKREAAAQAALDALRKQKEDDAAALARKHQQEEADKAAAARKLAEIEAGLKAEREAAEAKAAEAKRKAEAKAAEEQKIAEAKREEEKRKADAAAEASRKAEEARAKQAAEAAEKALAAKRAQEEAEAARLEAEQAAHAHALEDAASKERLQREADARAAEARALEEAVARARDEQRAAEMEALTRARLADLAEVQRQEAEAARVAEAKAAQEKAQREAEAEQKRLVDEACVRDLGKLQSFRQGGQSDAIDLLRHDSKCPALPPAADKALREIADAAAKVCEGDMKALARVDAHDDAALTAAASQYHCPAAKSSALELAEHARADKAAAQAVCAQDEVAIAKIDPSLPESRAALTTLGGSACPATREHTAKLIAEFDARLADIQDELVRVGCLAPAKASRKFDDATRDALAAYFTARHAPSETLAVTQGLLDELTDQDFKICAPSEPPAANPAVANVAPAAVPTRVPHAVNPLQSVAPPAPVRIKVVPSARLQPRETEEPAPRRIAPPKPAPVRNIASGADIPHPARVAAPKPARSSIGEGGGGHSAAPSGGGGGGAINIPSF